VELMRKEEAEIRQALSDTASSVRASVLGSITCG